MRKIEILNLKKQDINFQKRKITIQSAKNHKLRTIDIDLKLTITLYFYCKNLKYDDYLFNLKCNSVSTMFYQIMKKSNLQKITFHDLRHIYASYLLSHLRNCSNSIRFVQMQLRTL